MTDASKDAAAPASAPPEHGPERTPANTNARSVFAAVFAQWKLWLPAVGGLSLLLHFWRIGYAPTLSFSDLGTVLGAMLLSSVLGLFAAFALFLLPLFMISQWVEGGLLRGPPSPPPEGRRLSDRARNARDRRTVRGKRSKEDDPAATRLDFSPGSLPSFWTAGIVSFALYALVMTATYQISMQHFSRVFLTMFTLFSILEVGFFLLINRPIVRKHLRFFRKRRQQWLLLFLVYMGSWPLVLLPFLHAGATFLNEKWPWVLGAVCAIPFLHWIWFLTTRIKKTEVLSFRAVSVAFVVLISGLPLVLLDASMNTFGLGMMPHVDLVLTSRGCEIVHAAWPERVCAPDHREKADAYRLENIEVLTRIGTHYYIGAPGAMAAMDDNTLPRFPIPTDEVLSWRRRPPEPDKGRKSTSPTPGTVR